MKSFSRRLSVLNQTALALLLCAATPAVSAMSQPPIQNLNIINRCTHEVEVRVRQKITRPWPKVPRRFVLTAGERLETEEQRATFLIFGKGIQNPPKVSFRHQDKDVAAQTIFRLGRGIPIFQFYNIVACPENMTEEDKMSDETKYHMPHSEKAMP